MKLNEQIAFLRREKCVTQEELARVLGVSNQSVSKWESAQCCPDIALLPKLAEYFGVSVDALLGCERDRDKNNVGDLILRIRSAIEELPYGDDFALTLRLAHVLHAVILSKCMTHPGTGNPGWDTESAIEHAGNGEWGYSCSNLPEMTTAMRRGTVLFSDNKGFRISNATTRKTAYMLRTFSDISNLKTLFAIYELTVASEDLHTSIPEIAESCGLPDDKVADTVTNGICEYLHEKYDGDRTIYRIRGEYMDLVPLIYMMTFVG